MTRRVVLIALLAGAAAAGAAPPEIDFMLHCQGCHGADGGGVPGSVPPLAGVVASFLTVVGGREYLVRVPGSAQSSLDDAELASLLNWLVHRFGPAAAAADAPPYTGAEVARVRRPPLTDVQQVRRALVAEIEAAGGRGSPAPAPGTAAGAAP